jgi:hypothetical protein
LSSIAQLISSNQSVTQQQLLALSINELRQLCKQLRVSVRGDKNDVVRRVHFTSICVSARACGNRQLLDALTRDELQECCWHQHLPISGSGDELFGSKEELIDRLMHAANLEGQEGQNVSDVKSSGEVTNTISWSSFGESSTSHKLCSPEISPSNVFGLPLCTQTKQISTCRCECDTGNILDISAIDEAAFILGCDNEERSTMVDDSAILDFKTHAPDLSSQSSNETIFQENCCCS